MTAKVTTTVELKSDLTGKPATATRVFTVDGATYANHLTEQEAGVFDKTFAKYMSKAHSVDVHPDTLREWAREQGIAVGDRGRIASEIREAYLNRFNDNDADVPAENVTADAE